MRLRAYILVVMAAVLLPALGVQAYFARQAQLALYDAVKAESVRLTTLAASEVLSVFEGAHQFLSATASIEAVADGRLDDCAAVLAKLARENPRYTTLSVSDGTGRIVCSSLPNAVGANVSHQAHFRRVQSGEAFAAGDYMRGRATGLPTLHLSVPFHHQRDDHSGLMTAGLNLEWLRDRLAMLSLPAGASVLLSDRNGTVLSRSPEGPIEEGSPIPTPLRAAIESRDYGLRDQVDRESVRRFFVTQPIGGAELGLHISVGINAAAADGSMRRLTNDVILLIAVVAVLALAWGAYLGRRLIERPLELLLGAMEGWRADQPSKAISLHPAIHDLGEHNEFRRLATSFDIAVAAVEERDVQFRQIGEALEDGLLICEDRGKRLVYASPSFWRLTGLSPADAKNGLLSLLPLIDAEDHRRIRRLLRSPTHRPFDTQYRLCRSDGDAVRIRHRRFPVNGRLQARSVHVLTDVTREHEAVERQMMLAREVDHRAKNILAVVQSLVRLTPADDPKAFAKSVDERIQALARAHSLLASSNWQGARLDELARGEFASYAVEGTEPAGQKPRFILEGAPLDVRPEAVQAIAMVLHELTTNSVKYGALSSDTGTVKLSWSIEADNGTRSTNLRLRWTELGGPEIAGQPSRRGFGSRLVQTTIRHQLHGDISFEWRPEGLDCLMVMPTAYVALVPPKLRRAAQSA